MPAADRQRSFPRVFYFAQSCIQSNCYVILTPQQLKKSSYSQYSPDLSCISDFNYDPAFHSYKPFDVFLSWSSPERMGRRARTVIYSRGVFCKVIKLIVVRLAGLRFAFERKRRQKQTYSI